MAKKNNNTMYMVAGAGVLAYLLLGKKSSAAPINTVTPAGGNVNVKDGTLRDANGYPLRDTTGTWIIQPPASYPDQTIYGYYYKDVILPAMIKYNPNVGNSGYRLTDAEAQQLLDNYRELREGLGNLSQSRHKPLLDVARTHWNEQGVAEGRTFLKFLPTNEKPYTGPLENPNGSSGSWITKALGVATSFIPVYGSQISDVITSMGAVDDGVQKPEILLNNKEIEVIITGGALMNSFLPMFFDSPDGIALGADAKLNELLTFYTQE